MNKFREAVGVFLFRLISGVSAMNFKERLVFLGKVVVYAVALFACVVTLGIVLCA